MTKAKAGATTKDAPAQQKPTYPGEPVKVANKGEDALKEGTCCPACLLVIDHEPTKTPAYLRVQKANSTFCYHPTCAPPRPRFSLTPAYPSVNGPYWADSDTICLMIAYGRMFDPTFGDDFGIITSTAPDRITINATRQKLRSAGERCWNEMPERAKALFLYDQAKSYLTTFLTSAWALTGGVEAEAADGTMIAVEATVPAVEATGTEPPKVRPKTKKAAAVGV